MATPLDPSILHVVAQGKLTDKDVEAINAVAELLRQMHAKPQRSPWLCETPNPETAQGDSIWVYRWWDGRQFREKVINPYCEL